ncbi:MAG: helix-turn-helix domain-containing protein [Firmicutes bacterium]|nr:helix-turn-helix domain-containing protein [Bacillota bacterium]
MDIYDRIELLLKKSGLNRTRLCERTGISYNTMTSLFKRRSKNVDLETIRKIAMCFNTTLEYLITGDESYLERRRSDAEKLAAPNIFTIERKSFPLSAPSPGKKDEAAGAIESYIESGTAVEADFCMRASGDGLSNARIMDRDIVFVKKQNYVRNGEVAAVWVNNETLLRRVYYYPEKKQIVLQTDNVGGEPVVYMGDELNRIRVLGKAVAFQSDVK